MIIGAIARIGIVCEAMIQGIRLRSSVVTWTISTASRMPSTVPKAKPSERRGQRHPGVVDEAALGRDRRVDDGLLRARPAIWCGAGSTGRSCASVAKRRSRSCCAARRRARRHRPRRCQFIADRRRIPERRRSPGRRRAQGPRCPATRERLCEAPSARARASASVVIGMPRPQALADAVRDRQKLRRLADVQRALAPAGRSR